MMADLETFRKKVRRYYRKKYHQDGKTRYTQSDLAALIPMNEDELGKRLNGYLDEKTGRVWQLTEENVLDIVLRLAELEALTWEQAVELLNLMDFPVQANYLSWHAKLRQHLAPPDQESAPIAKTLRTAGSSNTVRSHPFDARLYLFHPPNLPDGYVPRSDILEDIKHQVLEESNCQTIGITTALRGAGGFGKTTLAVALCHDSEVQAAFPDILWIELGEQPPRALDLLNRLLILYETSSPEALTLQEAQERWQLVLRDRTCLLVIDDVWQQEALSPLLQGGAQCRHLVTTRNDVLLPRSAVRVVVDAMTQSEAVQVLCQDDALPAELAHSGYRSQLEALADRLGCWPLLLTLARGMLTDLVVESHANIAEALATLAEAYETCGVTAFRLDNVEERQRTAAACLKASLEHLETFTHPHYHATERYQELAVFPEDTDIPLATLQIYWKGSGGLQPWATKDLCIRLHRLSLLLTCDLGTGAIRLHDVIRSYLIQLAGKQEQALHQRLLDAYQHTYHLAHWAHLPRQEMYLWQHLILHLCKADQPEELQTTLTDLLYATRKALYLGVPALEADLVLAITSSPNEEIGPSSSQVASLHRSIMRSHHLLQRASTETEIGGLMLSALQEEENLATPRLVLEQDLPRPFLTTWHSSSLRTSSALARILQGHSNSVTSCVFSPDGKWIASASHDETLKVWDAATGAERHTLTGHVNWVNSCAFSPDSKWIVSASDDHTLKVWDAATGAEQRILSGHRSRVNDCAFSPDGAWIVSASYDETLKVWGVATGAEQRTLTGHTDVVRACAFSPDGKWIVSASRDETLKVWDAATGAERHTLIGHTFWVNDCAFSPDGKWIVSASYDRTLKVWDAATGAELHTLTGHTDWVNSCVLSLDGKWIVSASHDGTLKLWEAAIGTERYTTLTGHHDWVNDCAFSPDGKWIVSASDDRTLKVWDAATGEAQQTLTGHSYSVSACAFSPDGKWIVSASDDETLKVWDAATGVEQRTLEGHHDRVLACAFSPDGTKIVTASQDETLKVRNAVNAATGAAQYTIPGRFRRASACAFSPDGKWIVSNSEDGALKVWDAATGAEQRTLTGHTDVVRACAFSPDGKWIASASRDETLKVWDAATGAERHTLTGHVNWVNSCAFSPDSKWIVSTLDDHTLKVWEVRTELCLLTYPVDGNLRGCAFHPNGEHLVAWGSVGLYFLRLVR